MVTKVTNRINSRCHVHIIHMQPEHNGFNYVLNYQDFKTKYRILQPLRTNAPEEIAQKLVHIFRQIGAPYIILSNDGVDFLISIIKSLKIQWPELIIVQGSQDSVDKSNQTVKDAITGWMIREKTNKWTDVLRLMQYGINQTYNADIKGPPYIAMFAERSVLRKISDKDQVKHNNMEFCIHAKKCEILNTEQSAVNKVCIVCDDPVVIPDKCIECKLHLHRPNSHLRACLCSERTAYIIHDRVQSKKRSRRTHTDCHGKRNKRRKIVDED